MENKKNFFFLHKFIASDDLLCHACDAHLLSRVQRQSLCTHSSLSLSLGVRDYVNSFYFALSLSPRIEQQHCACLQFMKI
jgi:hypothetical protein